MFITRMMLNPARRGARKLLASPQAMHAAVLAGFPPGATTRSSAGRTLWRLDIGSDQTVRLYIVSPSQPDLTHLVEQAGWPTRETWETRTYDRFLDRLDHGQRWAFRLTANPVHSVSMPDGKVRRLGHITATAQQQWLVERSGQHGFDLPLDTNQNSDVVVTRRQQRSFRRGSGRVTLTTAQYDGTLLVTDPDRLRATLKFGVGRAKGYGCGLMTLVPPQTSHG